jgi:hypothetical protein
METKIRYLNNGFEISGRNSEVRQCLTELGSAFGDMTVSEYLQICRE